MDKKYRILFWHGNSSHLDKKLEKFCYRNESDEFIFEGPLEDFSEKYNEKFLVYPNDWSDDGVNWHGTIGITQHSSFESR